MGSETSDSDRRAHQRYTLQLAVTGQHGGGQVHGHSEDLSVGGAKIHWDNGPAPDVGEKMDVQVALPGTKTLRAEAEVRWRTESGICGVAFDRRAQKVIAAFFAGAIGLAASSASAAQAAVPTFDENADITLEADGSERPDEFVIETAFFEQNAALDKCLDKARGDVTGEAEVSILLDPKGDRPLGINAKLPGSLAKQKNFRECIRGAAADAPFPAYDGPPVVVNIRFDLDPGYEIEEDW